MLARLTTSLLVAVLLSATLVMFGPLTVYFGNLPEFAFSTSELLLALWPPFGAAALLLLAALMLLQGRAHEKLLSVLLVASLCVWIQGNLLVWDYGLLDGRPIDWDSRWHLGVVDGLIWLVFLLISFLQSKAIRRSARSLCLALLLIQIVSTVIFARAVFQYRSDDALTSHLFLLDDSKKFTFSSEKNVILLILDGFQSSLFQELLLEDPSVREPLDGFTYYRNNIGGFTTTCLAIPALLTGQFYDNSKPYLQFIREAYLSESSLPRRLKEHGFYIDLYTIAPYVYNDERVVSNIIPRTDRSVELRSETALLFDLSLFRALPHFLKRHVHNGGRGFLRRTGWGSRRPDAAERRDGQPLPAMYAENLDFYEEIDGASFEVTRDKRMLKVFHLHGTHPPPTVDEEARPVDPIGPTGDDYRRAGRGVLRIVERFLERLREIGVYDQSMIVLVGDHGLGLGNLSPRLRQSLQVRYPESSSFSKAGFVPLLLLKPLLARGLLKESDAPVSNADIPDTVFSVFGIDAGGAAHPILSVPEESERERYFYRTSDNHVFNAYYSAMDEKRVRGFSWADGSWRSTGRRLGLGDPLAVFGEVEGKKHVGALEIAGVPAGRVEPCVSIDSNRALLVNFSRKEPRPGDALRLRLQLTELTPGHVYRLSAAVFDPYSGRAEGFFSQTVKLGEMLLLRRDIGQDGFGGWRPIEQVFLADSPSATLTAEIRATGIVPREANWGYNAKIGIKQIEIQDLGAEAAGAAAEHTLELISVRPLVRVVDPGGMVKAQVTWRFPRRFPEGTAICYDIGNTAAAWPRVTCIETTRTASGIPYRQVEAGAFVTDTVTLEIPAETPPGDYALTTSVCLPEGFETRSGMGSDVFPNQGLLFRIQVTDPAHRAGS